MLVGFLPKPSKLAVQDHRLCHMYSVNTNSHDVKFCGYNDKVFTPQKFCVIWYLTAIIMSLYTYLEN